MFKHSLATVLLLLLSSIPASENGSLFAQTSPRQEPDKKKTEASAKDVAERAALLQKIIDDAAALDPKSQPQAWAKAQMRLGHAWMTHLDSDENLRSTKSIAAYEAALTVLTPESDLENWILAQRGIVIAWMSVDSDVSTISQQLDKAIAAADKALSVIAMDKDKYSAAWRELQIQRGVAWSKKRDQEQKAVKPDTKAIKCACMNVDDAFMSALSAMDKVKEVKKWGIILELLGENWRLMPADNDTQQLENLRRAVTAYERARDAYIQRKDLQEYWAYAQLKLAQTLSSMPLASSEMSAKGNTNAIAQARAICQEILSTIPDGQLPEACASTHALLGKLYRHSLPDDTIPQYIQNLHQSIASLEKALSFYTRAVNSASWQSLHLSLADSLLYLSYEKGQDQVTLLRLAIASQKAGMTNLLKRNENDVELQYARMILTKLREKYEAANTDPTQSFDSIKPAE